MSNKWEYACSENKGSSIAFYPLYGGELTIMAEHKPDRLVQELKFKYQDFVNVMPLLKSAIEEIKEGSFDYYSGKKHSEKIVPICGGKGWFQILPIEEDVICLQMYSDETRMEISVILDTDESEQFLETALSISKKLAA